MEEYSYDLRIPKERIAVIIGKGGDIKNSIEDAAKVRLDIDSKEGDVTLSGSDPILLYSAREVIKAIGRGFNPETAISLLKQDYALEIVSLMDYAKTKNDVVRLKGRVIGSEGKSRRTIEGLCMVSIVVYGKTVGIIGEIQGVTLARRAVESLLSGSPHANVYKWLERQRRELALSDFLGKKSDDNAKNFDKWDGE